MAEQSEPDETIDAIGLKCPEPVMLLHAAMRRMLPGQEVAMVATDPSTQRDVAHFCEFLGHTLLLSEATGDRYAYRIRKAIR